MNSACDCCVKPPSPYVMRLSAVGKYLACNSDGGCGFRDGDTIYERAETVFTYPSEGQPDFIPEDFNGETFTLIETATISGCAPPTGNLICDYNSNIDDRPPPPFRSDPPIYSNPRAECELCTPAEDFPEYWMGDTPVTFWFPPAAPPPPNSVDSNNGIYYGFPIDNWPIGRVIAAGASIGVGGYLKNTFLMKWRFEHTFTPTCYLKVWFIKRIRTFNYSSTQEDYIMGNGGGLTTNYPPTTTYEVLPYTYEWNPTQTPCIGKSGDNDDGGVFNEYAGSNPYVDVIASNNINDDYPIVYGAEQETEDPMNYCDGPKTLADISIAVWKYSFIKNYEPEDPSEGFPFVADTSGRTQRNGFPLDGFGAL